MSTPHPHLMAMEGIADAFRKKDFSRLGDFVAENCIDHAGGEDVKGLAAMRAIYEEWAPMFDITGREVVRAMADDEYAIVWTRFRATMRVDAMGLEAGSTFEKADIEVARFEGGKVVEHWTFIDPRDAAKVATGG